MRSVDLRSICGLTRVSEDQNERKSDNGHTRLNNLPARRSPTTLWWKFCRRWFGPELPPFEDAGRQLLLLAIELHGVDKGTAGPGGLGEWGGPPAWCKLGPELLWFRPGGGGGPWPCIGRPKGLWPPFAAAWAAANLWWAAAAAMKWGWGGIKCGGVPWNSLDVPGGGGKGGRKNGPWPPIMGWPWGMNPCGAPGCPPELAKPFSLAAAAAARNGWCLKCKLFKLRISC